MTFGIFKLFLNIEHFVVIIDWQPGDCFLGSKTCIGLRTPLHWGPSKISEEFNIYHYSLLSKISRLLFYIKQNLVYLEPLLEA